MGRIAIRASNSAEFSSVRGFETPSAPDEIRAHVKKHYSSGRSYILITKTLSFEQELSEVREYERALIPG